MGLSKKAQGGLNMHIKKIFTTIVLVAAALVLATPVSNAHAASKSTNVKSFYAYNNSYKKSNHDRMLLLKYKKSNGKYFKSVHTPSFGSKYYTYNSKVDKLNGRVYWYADDANLADSSYASDWSSKLSDLKYNSDSAKDDMNYYRDLWYDSDYDDPSIDYYFNEYMAASTAYNKANTKYSDFKYSTKYYVKTSMKLVSKKKGHVVIKSTKKSYHGGHIKISHKTFKAYIHN